METEPPEIISAKKRTLPKNSVLENVKKNKIFSAKEFRKSLQGDNKLKGNEII